MQWQRAGFAELAYADREHAIADVEITSMESNRLTDPHPCDGQEPDQRPVGRLSVRPPQRCRYLHQGGDLISRVEVGGRTEFLSRQQVGRRNLGGWINCTHMYSEATNNGEP